MKTRIDISVDTELKQKAKELGINLSGLTEWAIKNKLGKKELEIETLNLHCEFCGKEGEKETAEEVKEAMRKCKESDAGNQSWKFADEQKLTWLYPYEQWICNGCLKNQIRESILNPGR